MGAPAHAQTQGPVNLGKLSLTCRYGAGPDKRIFVTTGYQRPYLIAVNYAEFRGTANFGNA